MKRTNNHITRRRLPKGQSITILCYAVDFDGRIMEGADSKTELLSAMRDRGFLRDDFEIMWVAYNMDSKGIILDVDGSGETKTEAIENFWENYYKRYKA